MAYSNDKEYFRSKEDKFYFSIPSNDKQRKTFLGLDGTGFWYLILSLIPILALTFIYIYMSNFMGIGFPVKVNVILLFMTVSYISIMWTLASHDNVTGKQQFSMLYQIVKYRFLQKKIIRPTFANRKNTILIIEVDNNETNKKEL
ncbi:hypothetical protein [Mammaliicoccus sp. D-M17]|uniref:hypothetical protein n=1 Tax=Mammaliicoccus sp. D-M17 TaxID=2898677 RepID=UPI001EFB6E9A|nr:hypothetical protein [Mammaliicoccus sp. D-M17]